MRLKLQFPLQESNDPIESMKVLEMDNVIRQKTSCFIYLGVIRDFKYTLCSKFHTQYLFCLVLRLLYHQLFYLSIP